MQCLRKRGRFLAQNASKRRGGKGEWNLSWYKIWKLQEHQQREYEMNMISCMTSTLEFRIFYIRLHLRNSVSTFQQHPPALAKVQKVEKPRLAPGSAEKARDGMAVQLKCFVFCFKKELKIGTWMGKNKYQVPYETTGLYKYTTGLYAYIYSTCTCINM